MIIIIIIIATPLPRDVNACRKQLAELIFAHCKEIVLGVRLKATVRGLDSHSLVTHTDVIIVRAWM